MMLNQMMTTPNTAVAVPSQLPTTQTKDTQWLTLEVCREFQRNKCTRSDTECKYAHPPPHVEVQNGRVTACFDSIKGKCQRKEPPCKYLHPPQHLKEVLLQNGRRNLILKNSMISPYLSMPTYVHPGYTPVIGGKALAYPGSMIQAQAPMMAHPYFTTQSPQLVPWQHYMNGMYQSLPLPLQPPTAVPTDNCPTVIAPQLSVLGALPHSALAALSSSSQKIARPDRLEVCREYRRGVCMRSACDCRYAHPPDTVAVDYNDNHVTVCLDYVKSQCSRDNCRYYHPPGVLHNQNAMTGMIPITKRMALADNKGGMAAMYQPAMTMSAYQQALAMQLGQPQYLPVTAAPATYAPHPSLTRF